MSKAEALGLDKNKKKFDIREEYYVRLIYSLFSLVIFGLTHLQKLSAAPDAEWENKRVPRPKGVPEWGVPPTNPTSPPPDHPISTK